MDIGRLVAMANDIAAFFDSESDKAIAADGVRSHLVRFWDPRMRREIIAHLEGGGAGGGLHHVPLSRVGRESHHH